MKHGTWFRSEITELEYGNYSNMLYRLISNLGFFSRGKGSFFFENSHVLKYATVILKNKFMFKTFEN